MTRAATVSALSCIAALATCATDGPTENGPVPANVVVTPSLDTLYFLGDTVTVSADVADANGAPLENVAVSWSSSAASVATVSAAGLVRAVGNGTAHIVGAAGILRDSMRLVVDQRPNAVLVSPSSDTLVSISEATDLVVMVTDEGGAPVADATVTWTSSDDAVATVDDTGVVTAVANGSADIVATSGAVADTAAIVVEQEPAGLTTSAPAAGTRAGDPFGVTVTLLDALGARVAGAALPITIALEPNDFEATLTGTLTVTSVDGTATFDDLTVDRGGRAFALSVTSGQLSTGIGPFDLPLRFTHVSLGRGMGCGLTTSGDVYCWGRNETGGLGTGGADGDTARPSLVTGDFSFTQVDVGSGSNENGFFDGFACGLVASGAAYCWGRNAFGQLGDGTTTDALGPVAVSGGLTFSRLVAGRDHVCGLTPTGEVHCWGRNTSGQLGNGDPGNDSNVPVQVAGAESYAALFVDANRSCGVATAGTLYCWVSATALAGEPTLDVPTPLNTAVTFGHNVSPGWGLHMCGLDVDGAGYCWGQDLGNGELGTGTPGQDEPAPAPVVGGHEWLAIGASLEHSCGLRTDGSAMCWGRDFNGELGQGAPGASTLTPAAVVGGLVFVQLAVGADTTCGLVSDGDVYCWGSGLRGERGDGTFAPQQATPVRMVVP